MKRADEKRFKKLVSEYIKQVATEKVAIDDPDAVDVIIVTKAEALARQIWARALGTYQEEDKKTGKMKKPPPDKAMIELIIDRTEGRVGTVSKPGDQISIPDRISEKNKQRLNKLA